MNIKVHIFLLCAFELIAFTNISVGQNSHITKNPNIILILVDDLGYGDLSCQGGADILTPNIDAISKNGLTFSNFYANSTVCSPSRASILSGRYPDMVGVPGVIRQVETDNWGYLAENAKLLPSILKTKGYETGMIGKWHLGLASPNTPNEKGFDFFKGFLGDMMDDYWTHLRGGINWMRLNEDEIDPEGHATDLFTDWTLEYLKEHKEKEAPFFLYLAYNAPHFPIQPPKEYLDEVIEREKNIPLDRAKNVALIEHLDYNIGRITKELQDSGLDENTLIIFTSDNGGSLRHAQSNGKLRGGKQDMFEGGIRIPTYFNWKNHINPESTSENLGLLMDIYPTICDLIGLELPSQMDGMSLLPTIKGETQNTDNRYVFWVRREGGNYGGQAYYAARYKEFKIVQNSPFEAIQYFNLKTDPYETKSLDISENEVFKNLRTELREHIRKAGAIPWQQ